MYGFETFATKVPSIIQSTERQSVSINLEKKRGCNYLVQTIMELNITILKNLNEHKILKEENYNHQICPKMQAVQEKIQKQEETNNIHVAYLL